LPTQPSPGPCHRCTQHRPLFTASPEWGRVPSPLCTRCWSAFADARAGGTYVDFNDAFDNATDAELEAGLTLTTTASGPDA